MKALCAGKQRDNRAEIAEQAVVVRREFVLIEKGFVAGPWFMGARLSAADIAIYPFLKSLFRAAAKPEAEPMDLGLLPMQTH